MKENDKEFRGIINRCPNCGTSEVTYNIKKQKLVCNYCHSEFVSSEIEGIEKEAKKLNEEKRTIGTNDIKDKNDILTLKCTSCGAEIVINTNESMNARCHWCRNILSVDSKIANGSVPDFVLPFKLEKQHAQKNIEKFVKERRFFANSNFKKEFTTNNIMGVYFPYLLIDANCHAVFIGEGGHVARSYTIVTGKDKDGEEIKKTVYDIDIHHVERDFDIAIDDLSIESSKDKLNKNSKEKTTNIINSIMPFDTENCIKYESNYLIGFSSEKRDVNVDDLKDKVNQSLKDIARHSINSDLKYYDSGIKWETEKLEMKGQQWSSSYFPVWLYSYQDHKKIIHYVAVNGRTGETMGSIPINKPKLVLASLLLFLISIMSFFVLLFLILIIRGQNFNIFDIKLLLLSPLAYFSIIIGLIFYLCFYYSKMSKYRNKGKRHKYEIETKNSITNIKTNDYKLKTLRERSSSLLFGANNKKILGEYTDIKKSE